MVVSRTLRTEALSARGEPLSHQLPAHARTEWHRARIQQIGSEFPVSSKKTVLRVGLFTIGLLVAWVAVVFFGTSEGWWKQPLAPRGESAAFMNIASRTIDSGQAGNAVMALISDGTVHGVHAVSVGAAVNADTVFQTASLSKWLTAWGVMARVEQGKIDLDAPVSRYLKRWTLPPSAFDNNKVTARRLLSHTAGLTDGLGYAGFAPGTPVQSLEASLTRAADVSPRARGKVEVGFEPGTEWRYSGGGYAVLQLLIEDVSGDAFEAYMQRVVFRPLGMVHSTFDWSPAQGTTLAAFYGKDARPATHFRFSAVAAASLYTSVSDLTRFLQVHLPGKKGERLAGEWVFWEAGRVDFLAFKLAMPSMLRWLGWGSLAIAILLPSVAWAMRRRHRRPRRG